jgi:hypothetical protein
MDIEEEYDAQLFWDRYGELVKKDLPVILRTQIKQSPFHLAKQKKISKSGYGGKNRQSPEYKR